MVHVESTTVQSNLENKVNSNTATNAGLDKRILRKLWREATLTETQLELISKLLELNLGFTDVEEFVKTQSRKLKSEKFTNKFKPNNSKIFSHKSENLDN